MISSRLFCHSAEWIVSEESTFDIPPETSFKLSKVRIDATRSEILSNQGSEPSSSATMYFVLGLSLLDGKRGNPLFDFGDEIVFDNQRYRINGIKRNFDAVKAHHIEVSLS